jgi:hypothetical protein
MQFIAEGSISKMTSSLADPIQYALPIGEQSVDINPLIGRKIQLTYIGSIHCTHCGRKTNKSFNQGYCYPCFKKLPQCDQCIVSPEKCHFSEGTCRDSAWGEKHCFVPHVVYLANSSGLKIGITRETQIPTRWIDQGAVQAVPVARVANRKLSGLLERLFAENIADKTNWRAMLKGQVSPMDLAAERDALLAQYADALGALKAEYGEDSIEYITDVAPIDLDYPVTQYPTKVVTHNLDKHPIAEGVLLGIKGQYLMMDTGVINLRKYTAYPIELRVE